MLATTETTEIIEARTVAGNVYADRLRLDEARAVVDAAEQQP